MGAANLLWHSLETTPLPHLPFPQANVITEVIYKVPHRIDKFEAICCSVYYQGMPQTETLS